MSDFALKLVIWQKKYGRRDLPWQNTRDPYAIWVSEIMLQQTQVSTVIPYYLRFMNRFPDAESLASAEEEEVLALWSGLGYYARARNLHRAAKAIAELGAFPREAALIEALPGVGRSTAAAIAAFAFSERGAILDGNVKRVLCRLLGVEGFPGKSEVEKGLWREAENLLPAEEIEAYTQGLMDLGATVCTRAAPACGRCPVADLCAARSQNRVAELPHPKPKKAVPRRQTYFLLLRHREEYLFEKRNEGGLWRGLYCFPEAESEEEAGRLLSFFGATKLEKLPSFEHAFTHFRLAIFPLLAEVMNRSDGTWLAPSAALSSPIPAPVKKLLAALDR